MGAGDDRLSRLGLFVAVALLSGAALGYEVLLTRLLAIVHWHHFAYMIISVALLGFGAAGTFVALWQRPLLARYRGVFTMAALGFGIGAPLAFGAAQRVPFNTLEIGWNDAQLAWLLALYLILALPFLCAATALALAFRVYAARAGALYRSDLLGAGGGALGIVLLLGVVPSHWALVVVGGLGIVAAGLVGLSSVRRAGGRAALVATCIGALALVAGVQDWLRPVPSPFKGLSLALTAPDARIVAERHGALGWLAVVESPTVPIRHAPGLSLLAPVGPPGQLGIFTDGDALSPIAPAEADLRYLEAETAALPYHLAAAPRVLVLGAGGGTEVLRARHHGAAMIDAVELNPNMVELLRGPFAVYAGRPFDRTDVRLHVADARAFVAGSDRSWDVVQLALLDSFSAASAGVYALDESTLYTVEAIEGLIARLAPGGTLAITRWLKLPPRDSLKLVATAAAALTERGASDPAAHIAMIRGWKTTTLMVKAEPLSTADIASTRAFARRYAFDLVWHPGLAETDANRFNRLAEPVFYDGARALLSAEAADFIDRYKFALAPATDDRPFFFHTLKWRTLPELYTLREQGGLPLVEWGFVILVAALVQSLVVGVVLALMPLARRRRRTAAGAPRWRVLCYFTAIGLAFLFIEIALMQRFATFLGHPLYAIAVVLAALLIFAGLGAGAIDWLARRSGRIPPIWIVITLIVGIGTVELALLPPLLEATQAWPTGGRIVLVLVVLAPLGMLLGMPFPMGLKALGATAPDDVPWAWAINGCASVISAVLAALIAVHIGFTLVMVCALALYLLAALTFVTGASLGPRTTAEMRDG